MSAEQWSDGDTYARMMQSAEMTAEAASSSRTILVLRHEAASELLEESAIYWRRDYDALMFGFVLGVLCVLAVQGLW